MDDWFFDPVGSTRSRFPAPLRCSSGAYEAVRSLGRSNLAAKASVEQIMHRYRVPEILCVQLGDLGNSTAPFTMGMPARRPTAEIGYACTAILAIVAERLSYRAIGRQLDISRNAVTDISERLNRTDRE